jgi:hypothetical protein
MPTAHHDPTLGKMPLPFIKQLNVWKKRGVGLDLPQKYTAIYSPTAVKPISQRSVPGRKVSPVVVAEAG